MSVELDRLSAALEGHYGVEREIGAGGMATVYLARDLKHHRQVAIKVLRPELAAAVGAGRFLKEIEIAARLQHAHVLPLYDSGEANGFLYYVMPFVKGESLRDRLEREGELPVADALWILRDVSDALAYAHREGIVHRDVKPDNVMLSENHAMVTDFGVAKAVSEATGTEQPTTTGVAIGTPSYMSPEQAASEPHIDYRADIYSLGAMAYEMLTGRPPFSGGSVQAILSSHVLEAPEPVTERRASVPPALESLVMRCLQKKPADRWQSTEELLHTLEVMATPSGGAQPVVALLDRKRRRFWTRLAAGMVLVVAAGTLTVAKLHRGNKGSSEAVAAIDSAAREGRLDDLYSRLLTAGIQLDDRRLRQILPQVAGDLSVATDPGGVPVAAWRVQPVATFASHPALALGETPISGRKMVAGEYLLRFMPRGRDTLTLLVDIGVGADVRVRRTLLPPETGWKGMVLVERGPSPIDASAPPVPAFLIDRTEVTNAQFAAFVVAGGYADSAYWPRSLMLNGRRTLWARAVRTLVDRSGLPGPRDWTSGSYPPDRADHPVTGITWYEAEAYARWAGKELPTRSEWYRAALADTAHVYPWGKDARSATLRANFDLVDTRPVASLPLGVSPFGCFDMAGNVREWLRDGPAGGGRSYVAGGSWQDPTYMFFPDHVESFDPGFAGPGVGFRLVTRVPGRR